MDEWEHYSLEWIHKIRERNYDETKDKPLQELIKESVTRSRELAHEYSS